MNSWRARFDICVLAAGALVASLGTFAQFAGFGLTYLGDDPIRGELFLLRGFWIAGLGGAGVVYGIQVGAGGSVEHPGGPVTYRPPRRRWPSGLVAIGLIPVWGVLSLPLGIMFFGLLIVGLCGIGWLGFVRLAKRCRRWAKGNRQ